MAKDSCREREERIESVIKEIKDYLRFKRAPVYDVVGHLMHGQHSYKQIRDISLNEVNSALNMMYENGEVEVYSFCTSTRVYKEVSVDIQLT